ncbi:putative aldouronate transport system substrate-binding protein [Pullulanibacillus pueri]|uniref:Sugar ABC transporter substrate-binding protein n=1 Tax=Pullulanibacillus pueri TaxID=1437324 RepID=A0A8J3EMV0_9BACL|nr:extracellular solute-binding protein [Pullulanibacillus pueri]MBM7683010.1 putative aldouronate transport system substrate-binding protein [Pullulanibacillus pueri]GGH85880.1 sugar ABC transporter substrate-binding protein [Pullulanibacillus pueri]
MKKSVIVLVCIAFISILLSGCSKGSSAGEDPSKGKPPEGFNKSGFPIVDKPVTMTMFADRSAANGPYKDMSMFQAYEKKTNIKVKFNDVPDVSFAEKKSLVFGSKNLPDIFFKANISPLETVKYGTNGVLIPLEGLIKKYAPNIEGLFEKYPETKKALTAPDGHIYTLSDIVTLLSARTNKIWLNQTMLKGVNMKEPKTTDELYTVLKAFKEKYPKNTPLSASSIGDLINGFGGAWGLTQQMGYNINVNNDKVHIWTADDEYKELLTYLHKLYQENLLDHEVPTHTYAQYVAKMQSGKVGLFFNQASDAFPQVADQYAGIAPLKGPEGEQKYTAGPITRSFGEFAITSTNKNPEAAIRWIDYFYGDEGSIFFRYGVEGKTFNYTKDGVPEYTDDVLKSSKGIGAMTPWPGGGSPELINEKNSTAINPPEVQKAADKIQPYISKQIYAAPLFDADTATKVNDLKNDIDTYVNEATAKFITGDRSLDTWDKYVSELKKMGLDKLEKYYQDAYDKQYK